MSIIGVVDGGVLLDHSLFIQKTYSNTYSLKEGLSPDQATNFRFKPEYFAIETPYLKTKPTPKTRKRKLPPNSEELAAIEYHDQISKRLERVVADLKPKFGEKLAPEVGNNEGIEIERRVMDLNPQKSIERQEYQVRFNLETVDLNDLQERLMTYTGKVPRVIKISQESYLIPANSSFLCSDQTNLKPLMKEAAVFGKYDVIVMDPPWKNKSAKRGRKYDWLDLNQIKRTPLSSLLKEGGYVFVWVTNKQKLHRFVKNELFVKHGITHVGEWHWVKLTIHGEPLFDFESVHKKPYETIIIGRKFNQDHENAKVCLSLIAALVICSVPCAVHSHKPPLADVIKAYAISHLPQPKCLELFARNLTPGWTSWGNEVLYMQKIQDHYISSRE